ncbi:NAD(P)-dependent oxidoreductase [Thermoplasma sp.]|uniref:NAD(P)-dependent oxidoreductase n=1 Tax=Thermoplasma sp. TaxID=1973142 RepID=UPI0012803AFE|nr:NAD(P)-dependent oxidoreductase [Thermoplasma sp.]KAA8922675.1 MAG: NAD(P)-dependent oxidoreductase [Thermoplasma sp.]
MQNRVLLAGLGVMGSRIASNFASAGKLAGVYDRNADKARNTASALKVKYYTDLSEAVRNSDVIVTMLYDDGSVQEVYSKMAADARGKLFIDMSTISPETSVEVANTIKEKGGKMYDAPVIGTSIAVERKALVVLVGGDRSGFDDVRDLLSATANQVVYIGGNGSGLYAKLVNNLFLGSYMASLAEAVKFGRKNGIPDDVITDVLTKYSSARSPTSELKVPKMISGDYSVQFSIRNMLKDMEIVDKLAAERHVVLPMASLALQIFRYLMDLGYGEEDIAAIYRSLR